MIGTTVLHYNILEKLGEGATGIQELNIFNKLC